MITDVYLVKVDSTIGLEIVVNDEGNFKEICISSNGNIISFPKGYSFNYDIIKDLYHKKDEQVPSYDQLKYARDLCKQFDLPSVNTYNEVVSTIATYKDRVTPKQAAEIRSILQSHEGLSFNGCTRKEAKEFIDYYKCKPQQLSFNLSIGNDPRADITKANFCSDKRPEGKTKFVLDCEGLGYFLFSNGFSSVRKFIDAQYGGVLPDNCKLKLLSEQQVEALRDSLIIID